MRLYVLCCCCCFATGVRAPQFMSLLVKAMRSDVSIKRVAAFAKRLLQVINMDMDMVCTDAG